MPIENIPLSPTQFDLLQLNITLQSEKYLEAGELAQSGLQYVVLLQVIAPEVDLVTPFANHLINIEGTDSDSTFTAVVSALNLHAIDRGTIAGPTDSLDTRLNRYLSDNGICVTSTYARISSGAGFIIDSTNIEPFCTDSY
jgi:hypothetical protein